MRAGRGPCPPGLYEAAGEGSPGQRIRAAAAQLARRDLGAKRVGAGAGANPRVGVGEGETPASLVPRTVVRLLILSQNRSRQGGREERLEERMEEEREEGSVRRGLQDPPPGSPEMPQPSACLPALDAAPAHPGEPVGVRGAPGEPGAPSSSAQPPRRPPLRSQQRARAHRAAGCPRSGAQQARGSPMPLLPLLTAAAARSD